MTPSYISRVIGKGGLTRWPLADHSSKQNSGSGKAFSLQPSPLVQSDMGMRKPHLLLAMYASAKRSRLATMIGTEE